MDTRTLHTRVGLNHAAAQQNMKVGVSTCLSIFLLRVLPTTRSSAPAVRIPDVGDKRVIHSLATVQKSNAALDTAWSRPPTCRAP